MAVTCSSPHILILQAAGPTVKPLRRVLMLKYNQVSVRKIPAVQIRSSFQNKVFEDQSKGIICYIDDSGEMICEGYDEGPRIHQQSIRTSYNQRDVEIMDLLQQRWLQIYNGFELNSNNNDHKGVAVQEDFN